MRETRAGLHEEVITHLLHAMRGPLAGTKIVPLHDGSSTTFVACSGGEDPAVVGCVWAAGVFMPPAPIRDELKDEMVAHIRSSDAGTLSRPTKE
jgi:hypothetical protein